ncbi:tetratricopeptide repeat protein [Catenovulum sp. 2E275]|uniref:tetratricopeptide repeat protein n=1 Tax=Catenovulum sp. 2E275 TaxID=2980497 RepID=UPI0021D1ECAA|nr:tetratricopeptide repeat protein [Catenovulum sp. 2E275]MCU4675118.1 tetratricopeptide repeat protein [Catenovulum sp. 2E275]
MTDQTSQTLEQTLETAFQLIESGQQDEGDKLIQQVAKTHPEHYLSLYGLGLISAFMGKHEQAKQYFEQSIKMEPEYALSHYNLGFCYQKLNQTDLMIKHFYLALESATDEELELLTHVEAAMQEFKENLPAGITLESFIAQI